MVCNVGYMPYMRFINPYNCYRQPYMTMFGAGYNSYMNNLAEANGVMKGNKIVLQISYSCLIENLNNFIVQTSGAKSNEKLSQEELNKYNEIQTKAKELLQRVKNYGFASQNVAVLKAIDDINVMKREYHILKDLEAQLSSTAKTREISETKEDPSTETNNSVPSSPSSSAESSAQTDSSVSPEPSVPPTPEEVRQEVIDNYNENTKTLIDELSKNSNVNPEDINAIKDKQKEVEKAINDKKPEEEISKLCDELTNLCNDAHSRAELNEVSKYYQEDIYLKAKKLLENSDINGTDKEAINNKIQEIEKIINDGSSAEDVRKFCDEMESLLSEVENRIKITKSTNEYLALQQKAVMYVGRVCGYKSNFSKYIEKEQKIKLSEKIEELNLAISTCAPKDKLQKIYKDLETLYKQIQKSTDKLIDDSENICNDIYKAADNISWWRFWHNSTEDRKLMSKAVKKINDKNVKSVLNKWQELHDESIIDSLSKFDDSSLITYLAAQIQKYAKSINQEASIDSLVKKLSGNASNEEKTQILKRIVDKLNDMNLENY